MVGRSEELAHLAKRIASAEDGSGSVVFISGESGIGKTRLAAAAADAALKRGWVIAAGQAYPVESGIPYALFSDALVPLIRKLEPASLSVLTRGTAAELGHLFPALGATTTRDQALAGIDPSEYKARLLWNFSQFLGRFSAKQPLLVLLDNLQWADASSLELLHFVARQLESQKIIFICSYNDAESDSNPAVRKTEESLNRLGVLTALRLQPLSSENVAELVQKAFSADATSTAQFSAGLYDWTRGNPFFVEEMLKELVDAGRLRQQGGQWTGWDVHTMELPRTVKDAIASRLSRLSGPARTVANLAAVIGNRVPHDTLFAIAGTAEPEFVAALEELTTARVLEEIRVENDVSYDFTHPLLRQVLHSQIGHARVCMLHGSIAEALQARYGASALDHADELAFHFEAARVLDANAVTYLAAAGRNALEKYANREACAYLSTALESLERAGGAEATGGISREEILIPLVRARQRLGEYDRALELCSRALVDATARKDDAAIAEIEYRMGLASYWSGSHSEALGHIEAGLRCKADQATTLRLRLTRGICLQELGRLDDARAELETALDSAAAGGINNEPLLARAYRALLLLHAWTGPLGVASRHGAIALKHAESTGQLMLQWNAHWGMALIAGVSGDAPSCASHTTECERLAEQLGSPLLPLWSAELRVQYLSGIGEWDAALELAERTIARAQKLSLRTLLPRLYVWAGMMLLPRGETQRAKTYFDQAWTLSGASKGAERPLDISSVIPAHLGLAAYHLETGSWTEAIRIGEAGLAIADGTGHAIWGLHWLLPLICEAMLLAHEYDRAEAQSKRMRSDATRLQHKLGMAWSDACEALLVLYRDFKPDLAIPLLRSAAEKLDAIPMPAVAAKMRRRLAYALLDVGDPDAARAELRKAHDVFVHLRANAELDAIRECFREIGVRPPSRSVSEGAAGLTGREIEIARMVAARKSNKEIGGTLKISSRTVSTHLSNIFLKLSVGSRGELADFVKEKGLLEA